MRSSPHLRRAVMVVSAAVAVFALSVGSAQADPSWPKAPSEPSATTLADPSWPTPPAQIAS